MTNYLADFDDALRCWDRKDFRGALAKFTAVTDADPEVTDAWLGRIASGDTDVATLKAAQENARFLYRDTRRANWPDRHLNGRIVCPKYVAMGIDSRESITLGYAAALINAGQYAHAHTVLSKPASADNEPWRHFLHTSLFYVTQRWPDVLKTANAAPPITRPSATTVELQAATLTMAALAAARLGRYQYALDLLASRPDRFDNAYVRADGELIRGWVLRASGQAAEARKAFSQAAADGALLPDAQAALDNDTLILPVTTVEQITARTDPWDVTTQPTPEMAAAEQQEQLLVEADATLNKQIGLHGVKRQIKKLKNEQKINKARVERGFAPVIRSHHMVFTGPPGTGKTTIARVVANMYCGLGVLKKTTVIEAKRADFVGEHLGATAIKTNQVIDRALDGVLFIDEAYTLIQTGLHGGDAFGREAVDTLLARMEDDRDRLVVIIAGYADEIDRFLASNDGLLGRFPRRIEFPAYIPTELAAIAHAMVTERDSMITPAATTLIENACAALAQHEVWVDEQGKGRKLVDPGEDTNAALPGKRRPLLDVAGNGRFIRNVVEATFSEQMDRVADLMSTTAVDDDTMMTITEDDVPAALRDIVGGVAPGASDLLNGVL
ncbi:type VII secretion AAA-ATPase EccA [Mycolicibacterium houstonense]|uniref:type VII secretion AAA-ATPase EccA n=1 Tax=Mycolicibacterium houstonense TaxID=146021 RepID=UPI003F9BC190